MAGPSLPGLILGIFGALSASFFSTVRAEDVLFVSSDAKGKGGVKVAGEILDLTGQAVKFRLASGKETQYPIDRVQQVVTNRLPDQLAANEQLARGNYQEALSRYQAALRDEPRVWMRREILSQMVACYRGLGQYGAAGDNFLLLLASDPTTQFFPVIPLAWLPNVRAAGIEPKATQWLSREDVPAARLLGASFLLQGPQRAAMMAELQRLTESKDSRVAWLAQVQLWRASMATAGDREIEFFRQTLPKIPEELRGGAYYVVGHILATKKQPKPASLLLLRVGMLYSQDRGLAARSLVEAATQLVALGDRAGASRVLREVVSDYPNEEATQEAGQRLEQLQAEAAK